MSEISKLERDRNEAWNEWQIATQVVKFRETKLEQAKANERTAYKTLKDLNEQLTKEKGVEEPIDEIKA